MHALIIGSIGVGKSTLIRKVLRELDRPLFGFETRKEQALGDSEMGDPVYIYDAGAEHRRTEENLVGYCKDRHAVTLMEAFERYAPRLMKPIPPGAVVELDEIGFMESRSPAFCSAILSLLDGDVPVIAAVKDKENPFLEQVRSHPNAKCFYLTEENRNDLFRNILTFMREQLRE